MMESKIIMRILGVMLLLTILALFTKVHQGELTPQAHCGSQSLSMNCFCEDDEVRNEKYDSDLSKTTYYCSKI